MIARALGVAIFCVASSATSVAQPSASEFGDLVECFESNTSVYNCIVNQSGQSDSGTYSYELPDSLQNFFSRNAPSSGGTWMKTPADLYLERHGIR